MAANNETGVLQPWDQIAALCRAAEVPFFCDAAQWIGKMPATGLGRCDWVSGCAHKFRGPKGVGFLKGPSQSAITPLLVGGPQEEGRRPGTENVAGILAMLAALEEAESLLSRGENKERQEWREAFEKQLRTALPTCTVLSQFQPRLWNTVAALMPQADCQQRWVVKLDKAGFAVSTGSACSSGKEKPSHVLSAMGFHADESSRMLRFSSGWETTREQWSHLADAAIRVHAAINGGSNREIQ
jgi:cysteine desulfurase